MAYDVEVHPYGGWVVVTLWGEIALEERARALDDMLSRMQRGRTYRILVDLLGARPGPGVRASDDYLRRLLAEPKLLGCSFAYLCPRGGRANQAFDALAQVHGFWFQRFDAVMDALDWLLAPNLAPLPPLEWHPPGPVSYDDTTPAAA
jgi:hypothetical protein